MSATTWSWLVLALPLAGSMVIAFGRAAMPGRVPGWIGTASIALAFACSIGALLALLDHPTDERQLTDSLYSYADAGGLEIQLGILVDPLAVYMCLVVTGVSTLIHLYSLAYMDSDRGYARFFSYLNFFVFSMLLLVLAGNFVLLIVGWAFVGFASYALISFWYRRETATKAGMKAFVINVIGDIGLVFAAFFVFRELGTFDFLESFDAARETFTVNEGRGDRDLPPDLRRRLRQVGPGPVPHLAPGCDGGPDAGLRADPRRDHGHRGRLPDRAHVAVLRARADRRRHRRLRRPRDPADRGDDRARGHRPEADHRLLDHEPDRLHDHGRRDRRLRRRAVHAARPRLLQGAAVHGRGLGDRGDGQQPEHRPDERLPARDAVHLGAAADRLPGARRLPRHLRLLLQGRDPRLRRRPRRDVLDLRDRRLHRRRADRLLRVPDRLPGGHRAAVRGGEGARAGPHPPRRADQPRAPASPRTPTSASPGPSITSPSASGR